MVVATRLRLAAGLCFAVGVGVLGLAWYNAAASPTSGPADAPPVARPDASEATPAREGHPGAPASAYAEHTETPAQGWRPDTGTDTSVGPPPGESATGDGAPWVGAVRVEVPSVDVDAPVISVDVDDEQRLEVPDPDRAGWYTGRALPGETGPAVIVGHVDSWDGPAVFSGLERLEGGEAVAVTLTDGRRVDFEVTEVAVHRKEDFPTEAVYGDTAEPALRLVTCGGPFLADEGQYRDNVIVFAEFTSTIRTSGGEPTQQE